MPKPEALLLFVLSGWLLNLTPGPDMVYIASRTATGGMRAGWAAILGINAGCLFHTLAAALGLSALLLASAEAFTVVKWIGAAYLIWVGVGMVRSTSKGATANGSKPTSLLGFGPIVRQGFLTNVLNPKVALFFLAFLPQFIPAQSEHKALVFFLLGILFIFNSLFITVPFAWLIARGRERYQSDGAASRLARLLERVCGGLLIGVGIKLAFTESAS